MEDRLLTLLENSSSFAINQKLLEQKTIIEAFYNDVYKLAEIDFSIIEINESDKKILDSYIAMINQQKAIKTDSLPTDQLDTIIRNVPIINELIAQVTQKIESELSKQQASQSLKDDIQALKDNSSEKAILNIEELFTCLKNNPDSSLEDFKNLANCIGICNIDYSINNGNTYTPFDRKRKNIPKITEERLSEIFTEYGYNLQVCKNEIYDKVKKLTKEEFIEKIIQKNSEDNIRSVFEFFKNINISLTDPNNKNYNVSMLNVIALGSKTSIDAIIDICKQENIDLKYLIKKHSSIFKTKREVKEHNQNPGLPGPDSQHEIDEGSYTDFIANIELYKQHGYNIKNILAISGSVLELTNQRVKFMIENLINTLRDYNITVDKNHKLSSIINTLSWVRGGVNPEYVIRRFAELGELNYVLHNQSRLNVSPNAEDDLIFYRVKYCKDHNIKYRLGDNPLYYKYNGIITVKAKEADLGIYENNKNQKTGITKFNLFDIEKEKEVISTINKYIGNDSEVINDPLIVLLDSKYLTDHNLYCIDGVYSSRAKTLKVLSALINTPMNVKKEDLLIYALTYDSLVTDADIQKLKEKIYTLQKVENQVTVEEEKQPKIYHFYRTGIFHDEVEEHFIEVIKNYNLDGSNVVNDPLIIDLDNRFKTSDDCYSIAGLPIDRQCVLKVYDALVSINTTAKKEKLLLFAIAYVSQAYENVINKIDIEIKKNRGIK